MSCADCNFNCIQGRDCPPRAAAPDADSVRLQRALLIEPQQPMRRDDKLVTVVGLVLLVVLYAGIHLGVL